MAAWAVWVVLAAVLGVAEILTVTLFLGLTAVAALVAGAAAALGAGALGQLVAFLVTALVLLVVVRPLLTRVVPVRRPHRTGISALTGAEAVVLERVDRRTGRVRLAGEVWSARALDGVDPLEPGTAVHVVEIQGATAVVFPSEQV